MSLRNFVGMISSVTEEALDNMFERANGIDEIIERRKFRSTLGEEFSGISSEVVNELIALSDEVLKALPESIKDKIKELRMITSNIKDIDDEILAEKGLKHCLACDGVIGIENTFCPKCGAKQEELDVEDDDSEDISDKVNKESQEQVRCAICGHVIDEGDNFCRNCGNRQ